MMLPQNLRGLTRVEAGLEKMVTNSAGNIEEGLKGEGF